MTLLHLSLIPNIGPATILKIIHVLREEKINLDELYLYKSCDFVNKIGVSQRVASFLTSGLTDKKILDDEICLIEKYNIRLLSFLDENYPELLKQIYYPPPVIYCKGANLQEEAKRLAIVGSRKADLYAKKSVERIVPILVENNWEIVSGGAIGVDSMAHMSALQNKGRTIAVFGSGLLHAYPTSNKKLFRSIVNNNGTIVSCFPLNTPPNKFNFPARNRIISGLSKGCMVVQAAKKSGALITTQFGLDQGKQIFAIPGLIDNELSAGCHKLIQEGAKLVTKADDILEEFGETRLAETRLAETRLAETRQKKSQEQTAIFVDHPILKHLDQPTSIDELSNKTKISLLDLQNQLFSMQLEGTVQQNFVGLWESPPATKNQKTF